MKSGLFWLTVHSTTYPTASGHVVIAEGGQGTATVSGFRPGTDVTVWVFSTKTELATPRVGADGAATGLFVLPAQIKAGNHTIVVTGIAATGETVTLKLGFEVRAPGSSLSPKGGLATLLNATTKPNDGLGEVWFYIPIAAVLIASIFFLLGRRRRRNDENDEGQEI